MRPFPALAFVKYPLTNMPFIHIHPRKILGHGRTKTRTSTLQGPFYRWPHAWEGGGIWSSKTRTAFEKHIQQENLRLVWSWKGLV